MSKLIAIHALHLAAAVAGKVDVINPGQGFVSADHDDIQTLVDRGAVRQATSEDKNVTYVERIGAKAGSTDETVVDISKLKKAELVALAKTEEIQIDESGTNAQIVAQIEAGRAAKQDDLV